MSQKFFIPGIVYSFLLCFCTTNCDAQSTLDSLLKVLAKQKREDTVKLHLLNAVAKEYQNRDPSKGLATADAAIVLAGSLRDQNALAQAYLVKGQIYFKQNNYEGASDLYRQSLSLFEQSGDKQGIADCMASMGNVSSYLTDYPKALSFYEKAINTYEQIGNKNGIAKALSNTGRVYANLSNYPKAREFCQKALSIYEQTGEKRGMANTLGEIGITYAQMSDYPLALTFFQKALHINEQFGKSIGLALALNNIGNIYKGMSNFTNALEYFEKALNICRQIGTKDTFTMVYNIGATYEELARHDDALKYTLESIKIAEQNNDKSNLALALNGAGFLYYKSGNYINAWPYLSKGLTVAEQTGDKRNTAFVILSMGELLRDAPDSILRQIGIDPADRDIKTLEYFNKGKQIGIELNVLDLQRFALEDLNIMYEKQKNYAKALEAYKNYVILRDSIVNNEKEKKINHLNMQYEFDKKSDSIKLQEQLTDQKLQQQILLAKQQQQELELGRQQIALGQQQLTLTNKEKDIQQLAYLKTQADLQNEQLQKKEKEKLLIIAEKEKKLQLADAKKSAYSNKVRLYALLSFLSVLSLIAIMLWRNNVHKQKANVLLLQQKKETDKQKEIVEQTLEELKSTQTQLIQREKMASLGELTAGIAHEIQNPLNFVNNFSEVNTELIEEMEQEIGKGNLEEIKEIACSIKQNMEKINLHGRRADGIVKGMLQHSQSNTGKRELTDINRLADEYLRLSYHGFRAKDKSFNATIKTDFDASIEKINIVHQDIGRVLLNLLNNAFYSVTEKKKQLQNGFDPVVWLSTKQISLPKLGKTNWIEIRIKDNGMGIPQKTLEKIYQPFFTTKPSGQGTGLGLSLSYDIITKANGGTINAETKEGQFAEFIIHLPANSESKISAG